jgi:hypothetical protein
MFIPSSWSTHVVSLAITSSQLSIHDFSVDFTLYDPFVLEFVLTLYYHGCRGVNF